jgi:Sulfotransferase domain/N-terminal domain of galactosyltransferase
MGKMGLPMLIWWLFFSLLLVAVSCNLILIAIRQYQRYRRRHVQDIPRSDTKVLQLSMSQLVTVPREEVHPPEVVILEENPIASTMPLEPVDIDYRLSSPPLQLPTAISQPRLTFRQSRDGHAIVFCTTVKNRTQHLRETLPRNLADNPKSKFVVLDYNTEDDLIEYLCSEHLDEIKRGRLVIYVNRSEPKFRIAHAKNQAYRCGMMEGADILVMLDADNFAGCGFEDHVRQKFDTAPGVSYLMPDFARLPPQGKRYNKEKPTHLGRGFYGRLVIRANDLVKIGGYNEKFDIWGSEDIDLLARLNRLGLKRGYIDDSYLHAIAHSAELRFSEYPEARRYENINMYEATKHGHDTVVNDGNFGCGTVYRNYGPNPIDITPLPTRLFGIGFQRTGTMSLDQAFRILGYDSAHWKSGEWAQQIWREMNRWGSSMTIERENAVSDNPIPLLYDRLDKAYSGSKFILTIRDDNDWLRSVERFWTYDGNPQRWTWDGDPFSHKVHGIIYGQTTFDADVFLARYRRHNAEVLAYFRDRPKDLLVMDIGRGTGWTELCEFLDAPQPGVPYPHQNRSNKP